MAVLKKIGLDLVPRVDALGYAVGRFRVVNERLIAPRAGGFAVSVPSRFAADT